MSKVTKIDSHPLTKIFKKIEDKLELSENEQNFIDHEEMEWGDFDRDVKAGAQSFVIVGRALKEIKERKLHKFAKLTFEEYLRDRLGMSRSQGYRLMETGALAFEMEAHTKEWKPTYESHLRPLVKSLKDDPKSAAKVMEEATERAKVEDTPLSAKLVKEVLEAHISNGSSAETVKPKKSRMKKADFKELMMKLLSDDKKEEALELLSKF